MKQESIGLKELENYLNDLIDPSRMDDVSINGVQVERHNGDGGITRIATAVSASLETIERAAQLGVQALIVHHGIFLKKAPVILTGTLYKKIKCLMDSNIALLAYHLPLDAHRELGNNCAAARDLGLSDFAPFAYYQATPIGVIGTQEPESFAAFKARIEKYYGRTAYAVNVKDTIKRVAIVSGGGDKFIIDAARAGVDCLITGRVDEPAWDQAREEGISFLGLGHYTTEVVGPRALGHHIEAVFGIEVQFIRTENPF